MWIRLGNPEPHEAFFATAEDESTGTLSYRPLPGPTITPLPPPEDLPLVELHHTITAPRGVWERHAAPATSPAWVASDDPQVEAGLALLLGVAAGEPAGYLPSDSVQAAADAEMPGLDHTTEDEG